MKKITLLLSLIFAFALFFGCSKNNDEIGNSTITVVPIAPSNLLGTVISTTKINLSWTDNSTNETGFKIERKTGTGSYAVLVTTAANNTTYTDVGLIPSTTYIYRVCSSNTSGNSLTYSNEITLTTSSVINLPSITTTAVSNVSSTSLNSGGNISSDGGAAITTRGVCWSTSPNPTIALSTKTTDGSGAGIFTSYISGLNANTTYYIRAYSSNSVGTAYGNELSFITSSIYNIPGSNVIDIDGNIYQSVTNCNQTWMKQNLNLSNYTDGTPIPQVSNASQWGNLTTGAWCYYQNNTANGITYGKLYNWYAIAGIYDTASLSDPSLRKKLSPIGWHIPTSSEWNALGSCLGTNAGGKMKSTGTIQAETGLWEDPNTEATNESGFTGLPGGFRVYDGAFGTTQVPNPLGTIGWFGSSTENSSITIQNYWLFNNQNSLGSQNNHKNNGYSVRCIKD